MTVGPFEVRPTTAPDVELTMPPATSGVAYLMPDEAEQLAAALIVAARQARRRARGRTRTTP